MNSETFELQSAHLEDRKDLEEPRTRLYRNQEGFVVYVLNDKSKEYLQKGNIYDLCARAHVYISGYVAISVRRDDI